MGGWSGNAITRRRALQTMEGVTMGMATIPDAAGAGVAA